MLDAAMAAQADVVYARAAERPAARLPAQRRLQAAKQSAPLARPAADDAALQQLPALLGDVAAVSRPSPARASTSTSRWAG